jgi:hypothetical protein
VKISSAVRNISMKRPRITDVCGVVLNVVRTASGPGKRADTIAAAAIAPTICASITRKPLSQPTAPMRHKPTVTCFDVPSAGRACRTESSTDSTNRRIEQSSTDPKENPDINRQTEPESQRNVEQNSRIGRLRHAQWIHRNQRGRIGIRDLRRGKRKEKEQEGADEFTEHGDEVVADGVGEEMCSGKPSHKRDLAGFCVHEGEDDGLVGGA